MFNNFSTSLNRKTFQTFSYLILSLILNIGCASYHTNSNLSEPTQSSIHGNTNRNLASRKESRLNYEEIIDISKSKGYTYLSFMETKVKPALDKIATEGYKVADCSVVKNALKNVSSKVKTKAIKSAGTEKNLCELADELAGTVVTKEELPGLIRDIDDSYDEYTLSTFLGLVSGGGAAIKFYDGNYAYNIHYGTGEAPKDNRSGRSYGEGPSRPADDASDKAYLTDLQEYVTSTKDLTPFYTTLLNALTNSDTADYKNINDFGQTLLTDFLAVYTAEQDRNLMDGRITLHWDAALLEVTLLSAFHADQEEITLMFKDPKTGETIFTSDVVNQEPGGTPRTKKRKASLIDYWQFSSSTDPEHRNRSGINITKDQFRLLGQEITKYIKTKNPKLVTELVALIGEPKNGNLFEQLSVYLINPKTPKKLGQKGYEIAETFAKFLAEVRKHSSDLTQKLLAD